MGKIPLAPLERILKDSSSNIRVSKGATEAFAELLEEIAKVMANDAAAFADHARRKTIIRDDVVLLRKMKK